MAAFDQEFQITWFELAPSLQTMFLTLQNEMTVLQRNYTVMVNTLDTMQTQLDANTRDIDINKNEITIIKQNIGTLESNLDSLTDLIGSIDFDKIGDFSQLQQDMDQCMIDIIDLFRRMRIVEERSEENFNDIADLRIDVDNNTEWLNWISKLVEDVPDIRIDVDHNTEWLHWLDKLCEDIPDLRIDVDNNTEWISALAKNVESMEDIVIDLQVDMDHNVEWMQYIHNRMEGFIDEVVNIRIDVDLVTEWYHHVLDIDDRMNSFIDEVTNIRIDVDLVTEWYNNVLSINDRMENFIDEITNVRIDIDLVTEWYQQMLDYVDSLGFLDPTFVESVFQDTVDLRIDVDDNTERIYDLTSEIENLKELVPTINELVDNIPDIRTDIDNNTEWLNSLDSLKDDIPDLRSDIDRNTEWLHELDPLKDDVPEIRIDVDNNTEWLNSLEPLKDDVLDLRTDIDRNTEWLQENTDKIEANSNAIIHNREDIDINTELIEKSFLKMESLPAEILKDVEDYIMKTKFLNFAPKINFLQEDTVEVYPYYRMNNMGRSIMTSDQDSADIIYLIANDGVSTTNPDLFCGVRNNELQPFYFGNIQVNPKCFRDASGNKDSYIDDILCGSNNYIVVHKKSDMTIASTDTSGWYLIETKNSRDYGIWNTCKDLNGIWNDKIVHIVWIEDKDILIIFQKTDGWNDPKVKNIATMRTYKYSTMTFIKGYDIVNPFRLMTCNTDTTTFSLTTVEDNFYNGTCGDVGIKTDSHANFKMIFTVNQLENLVTMTLYNATVLHLPKSDMPASAPKIAYCCLRLTFNCPDDVFDGGSSAALICYQNYGDIIFDCLDKDSYFYKDNIDALHMTTSYSDIKDLNFITYHEALTYNSHCIKFNNKGQTDDNVASDMIEYGTLNPQEEIINTPDACPWGKWMYKYIMVWDHFFANCASMQYGDCVVQIDKWRKDPSDATALIPAPGSYHTVSPLNIFKKYGMSSCRMSDDSARYFRTDYTGTSIIVYEYTYTDTGTDFIITENKIKEIQVNTASWMTIAKAAVNKPSFDPLTTTIFYNANSDDFVMVFIDTTLNKTTYTYSDYGFLATLNSAGAMIKCFGTANISNYSTNWRAINSYVQDSKGVNNATPRIRNMTFLSSTLACCCYFYNCDGFDNEDFKNVYFTFNIGKNVLTMNNGYSYEEKNVYIDEASRGIGLIYSGPEYGLTFQGEKLDHSYTVYFTQKKIPNTWGSNKTDNVFLTTGPGTNRYKFQLKSSIGLIVYVPNIAIFLGGYFTQLENPLSVVLEPNTNNYIYLERDGETLEILAYASSKRYIAEGARTFNRICVARISTNAEDVTDIEYYRINNGYNDYVFH